MTISIPYDLLNTGLAAASLLGALLSLPHGSNRFGERGYLVLAVLGFANAALFSHTAGAVLLWSLSGALWLSLAYCQWRIGQAKDTTRGLR